MRWNLSQQSLTVAFCLLLWDPPLALYQLKVQGWIIQLLAASHVPSSLASRGAFCCDQEDEAPASPLGGAVQSSGKIVGVFSLHLHHLSWSVPAYFQLCIVSDELAVCFKGEANLFKRVSSFLLGADGISCVS